MTEMHALFTGRVQGVGFRATAQKLARELYLRGRAVNLADGAVEIIAQGDMIALQKLIDELKILFPGSRVKKISFQENPTSPMSGFSIGF